jgi:D-arabinose 1-dehydrogenase-like Zn-dependent alcohol dehydrogenase
MYVRDLRLSGSAWLSTRIAGLPQGNFPPLIFDVVLKRLTIRGSNMGTRNDLTEALAFVWPNAGDVRRSVVLDMC